ncbi:MAG: diaminopimelate epimerase [Alphaproteobacteria bacterium]
MTRIAFTKMHGLGNDFVVIDARAKGLALDARGARAIAARHTGIGCDQVIVMEPAANGEADLFMRIRNADGGEVAACGNATRCVAALVMGQDGRDRLRIQTEAGLLEAEGLEGGLIAVDMGRPGLDWRDIPLAGPQDTLHLDISAGALCDPTAVGMGNPHCVFFVDDADAPDLAVLGPGLEHHQAFPERANIGIAQIQGQGAIRLRVWERGAGITQACGTGACAALVAAHRRGLTGRAATVELDGGRLAIDWRDDDHVVMTGPAAVSFSGSFDAGVLA